MGEYPRGRKIKEKGIMLFKTKKKPTIQNEKWTYNEKTRMWVETNQLDQESNLRKIERTRANWKAYERKEAEKEEERQRVEKAIKEARQTIQLTDEEKELAHKIHIANKEPSYEEWKAAREAEKHQEE